MKIILPIDKQNCLASKYGGYCDPHDLINGNPLTSFPIEWGEFAPQSHYVHLILVDYDSNPVCNFTWLHWGVCNLALAKYPTGIPENFSLAQKDSLNQAINSGYQPFNKSQKTPLEDYIGYYGPFPPDKPHTYILYVITTSAPLNIKNGWYLNEFVFNLDKNQIIESKRIDFVYKDNRYAIY